MSALFTHLNDRLGRHSQRIGPTARAASATDTVEFVHLDGYRTTSEFRLYHDLLDAVLDEAVPRRGVGTDRLRERFVERVESDLSAGTVKGFLYELVEWGVLEWVQTDSAAGSGRRPSRPVARFPALPFRRVEGE